MNLENRSLLDTVHITLSTILLQYSKLYKFLISLFPYGIKNVSYNDNLSLQLYYIYNSAYNKWQSFLYQRHGNFTQHKQLTLVSPRARYMHCRPTKTGSVRHIMDAAVKLTHIMTTKPKIRTPNHLGRT